jgi:hypothetical protein
MTDSDRPTYYVAGEEVKVRGVILEDQPLPSDPEKTYTDVVFVVQFPGETETRQVTHVRAEGGISVIYDDLYERGMLPVEIAKGVSDD